MNNFGNEQQIRQKTNYQGRLSQDQEKQIEQILNDQQKILQGLSSVKQEIIKIDKKLSSLEEKINVQVERQAEIDRKKIIQASSEDKGFQRIQIVSVVATVIVMATAIVIIFLNGK